MQTTDILSQIAEHLDRIAVAAETVAAHDHAGSAELGEEHAYHWDAARQALEPVGKVNRVPLGLLRGLEDVLPALLDNTLQFTRGYGANNALLWGARGMGKSSLVKAIHAHICDLGDSALKRLVLVEINREDLHSLPKLMRQIAPLTAQFIVFCDDLSFDKDETDYKSLKTILDGGLAGRPDNVLFYATSNRRHLMPRDMIENERSTAINPSEAVEEKVSLSDRFGLWLGFHNCSQDLFLEMVRSYAEYYRLPQSDAELKARAIEWSQTRGARSGRVAIQLIRQLAGEAGISV